MSVNRESAVSIGYGRDEHNYPVEILEEPCTGRRYLAYTPETWWERAQYLTHLEAIGKRDQLEAADAAFIPVE